MIKYVSLEFARVTWNAIMRIIMTVIKFSASGTSLLLALRRTDGGIVPSNTCLLSVAHTEGVLSPSWPYNEVIKWKHFRVTGPLCGGFTGHQWIPFTKASDAELRCFFDLRQNKQLSKQSRRRWLETPSRSLWRHCNASFPYWLSRKLSFLQFLVSK